MNVEQERAVWAFLDRLEHELKEISIGCRDAAHDMEYRRALSVLDHAAKLREVLRSA